MIQKPFLRWAGGKGQKILRVAEPAVALLPPTHTLPPQGIGFKQEPRN